MRSSDLSPCRPRNRVNTRMCPRSSMLGISLSKPCQPEFSAVESEESMIEKENQRMLARKQKQRPKRLAIVKDTSLDNPTPQMIEIMNKIREKSASPPVCQKRHRHNSNCNGSRASPTCEDAPTQFTPAMEEVMRKRAERLSSSHSSESDGYTSSSSTSEGPAQMIYSSSSESEDSNDADATVYYSPIAPSPPSVHQQQSNNSISKSSSRGDTGRKVTNFLVSPREVAALLNDSKTVLMRTTATQTSPCIRVTRSISRQASPELF